MLQKNILRLILFVFVYILCTPLFGLAQSKTIPFSNKNLYYQGRINYKKDCAGLQWSGSSVTINFKGDNISAILKDADTANYYNIILDDSVIGKIHTDTIQKTFLLASGLSNKKHRLQLYKRTEATMGTTWFYGFTTSTTTKILGAPKPPKRKIEFYGNSISCGWGIEDTSSRDSGAGYFENAYETYSAITARHFNAQYACIARSGIGVMLSWFPIIMPEMYNRIDAADSMSIWNFNNYTPNIVVINLFQNDSWLINMPEHEQFKNRFTTTKPDEQFIINAYKNFVERIRSKYKNAYIICALGNMDATKASSSWPTYISKAVSLLHDGKIKTLFFKYKETRGHPNLLEQKKMAAELILFIDKNVNW
jgi:Carbohydrate esterase 2 N-terminal